MTKCQNVKKNGMLDFLYNESSYYTARINLKLFRKMDIIKFGRGTQMKKITAEYFTDPLCSWSWGNGPKYRKLREEFGDQIKIVLTSILISIAYSLSAVTVMLKIPVPLSRYCLISFSVR